LDLAGCRTNAVAFHEWAAEVVLTEANNINRVTALATEELTSSEFLARAGEHLLPCRYRLDGTRANDDWLNFQLDGHSTWLWSLSKWADGHQLSDSMSRAVALVADYLVALWHVPCYDCWEEYPDKVHVSTLATIYGGLTAAATLLKVPSYSQTAESIRRHILTKGVVEGRLRKYIGVDAPVLDDTGGLRKPKGDAVDASLLWTFVPFGVIDANSEIAVSTVEKIERDLTGSSGGIHRYIGDIYYGGGEWNPLTGLLASYWAKRSISESGAAQQSRAASRANQLITCMVETADDGDSLPEQFGGKQAPASYGPWVKERGAIANPLLWSHASFITAAHDLWGTDIFDS
jgi:GH15 family glucan-1,4-alpha-glucosidase